MNSDIINPESHGDAQFPPKPPAPPIPPIPPSFNQYIPPIPPAIKELSAGIAGQDIPPVLNMEYVLSRIDIILNDTKHIYKALDTISEMKPSESEYQGGQSDSGRAEAVAAAVQSRETTNQQMLKLLEKMYDDLKPKKSDVIGKFDELKVSLKDINDDEYSETARDILSETARRIFER